MIRLPICEIEKNSAERIRFDVIEYHGHTLADVRVYYDDGGQYKPSKKGLTISPAIWSDFLQGIEALGAELRARGLLPDDQESQAA